MEKSYRKNNRGWEHCRLFLNIFISALYTFRLQLTIPVYLLKLHYIGKMQNL